MTNMSQRDIEYIFERLRSGVVPERGLEAFAVGIDLEIGGASSPNDNR
jgi:P-loop Domain of unknown function (DUF2791)